MNLTVNIGGVKFENPVTVASGTFGYCEENYNLEEIKKLGAIIPKTITLHARIGNPPARIVETPAGMLNAIGIENPGADQFIQEKVPSLEKIGIPLIISISGNKTEEFISLVEKLNAVPSVQAIELNLSCPNLENKHLVAQDADATHTIIKGVKAVAQKPIIAKLSPNVTDIAEIAVAAQDAGADAVSLINTLRGMVIDVERRKSILGNITGGLSGPAIRPVGVYMVYQVTKAIKVPVIAMGGIMNAEDALQYLIAGATMVAVGTANFINPRAPLDVLQGIRDYMKRKKINNIQEIIGSFQE